MTSAEDVLDVFDGAADEPLSTAEVAAELDISQKAAWVHLSNLRDQGQLERDPGDELHEAAWTRIETPDSDGA